MQEEIENKAIALSLKTTKLTAKTLAKAFMAVLRVIRKTHNTKTHSPQGRQTVKRLTRKYDTKTIPVNGNDAVKLFDRVIKEKHLQVDYSFMKTDAGKYLLFFKSAQADAITAAFAEYTKRVLSPSRNRKTPILERLKQLSKRVLAQPARERERSKEASRDER